MQIGPFKLDRCLGQGGMATVWGGVHVELGTPVAFKFLRPDKDQVRGAMRFIEETKALARMNHPGIVRIFDAGLCPGDVASYLQTVEAESPYFVMEAIDGGILKLGAVADWQMARWLALSLLDALAHAHARDVIHRDIKPANILIDKFGMLKLTDFGISRLTHAGNHGDHDRITGTPAYMSPEQITGRDEREGPWTDLYAVGCLVYWLVCSQTPFRGSIDEILRAHVNDSPPPIEPRFDVPPELDAWIARLLHKDSQARYLRAADAALALMKMRPPEERAFTVTDDLQFDSPFFPTLEVLDIDESELASGTSTVSEGMEPPGDWRTGMARSRTQLLSTGPGMLEHREPEFRAREAERDALWDVLGACWNDTRDYRVGISGSDGVGRESLARWFGRRAHEVGSAHVLVFGDDAEYSARHQLRTWYASIGESPGATSFYATRGQFDELAEWDIEQIHAVAREEEIPGRALSAVHARWTSKLAVDRVVLYYDPSGEALGLFSAAATVAPARRLLVSVLETPSEAYEPCLTLVPFDDQVVGEIVSDLIGLTSTSLRALCEAADGNPGTGVDLARMAVRQGALEVTDSGLEFAPHALEGLVNLVVNRWPLVIDGLASLPKRGAVLLANADSRVEFAEVEAICEELGVSPAALLGALQDSGLLVVGDEGGHFAHPLARKTAIEHFELDVHDHALIARTFGRLRSTPRRRVITAFHAHAAGLIDVGDVVERARELRAASHVDAAVRLLERLLDTELDPDPRSNPDPGAMVCVELAECHLIRQQCAPEARAFEISSIDLSSESQDCEADRVPHDRFGVQSRDPSSGDGPYHRRDRAVARVGPATGYRAWPEGHRALHPGGPGELCVRHRERHTCAPSNRAIDRVRARTVAADRFVGASRRGHAASASPSG